MEQEMFPMKPLNVEKSPRAEDEGKPGLGAPGLFGEEQAASPRTASAWFAGNNDTSFGETMADCGASGGRGRRSQRSVRTRRGHSKFALKSREAHPHGANRGLLKQRRLEVSYAR
jgi:hypothetical protein